MSYLQKQVGPLSQAIRAAACLSLGQNITAKSVHVTSLYPYGVDVDKWSLEFFMSLCLYLKQNYAAFRRNFGGIWRFELFSLSGFLFVCSVNLGWFLKVQWQHNIGRFVRILRLKIENSVHVIANYVHHFPDFCTNSTHFLKLIFTP